MNQALIFGPRGLAWAEIPAPTLSDPQEALVRPIAVSVCDIDRRMLSGEVPVSTPIVLGHEAVAEVLEAGEESGVRRGDLVSVSWMIACGRCDRCEADLRAGCRVAPGGAVFGMPEQPWGGLFADVVKIPFARAMLTLLPASLPAASFVGLSCNLPVVCQAISPHSVGDEQSRVLVVGGRGALGLYAVAMAFALGARHVDYVDDRAKNAQIASVLGATPLSAPAARGDHSLAIVASVEPSLLIAALRSLRPEGVCEVVGPCPSAAELPLAEMYTRGVTLRLSRAATQESTLRALELAAIGRLQLDPIQGEPLPWERLASLLVEPGIKPVFVRARTTHA